MTNLEYSCRIVTLRRSCHCGPNGCIERFFRTLKEQLLWVRRFRDLEELRVALIKFRIRYNHHWILERLNYRTPAQARQDFRIDLSVAA